MECKKEATVIDLTPITGYVVGDRILGDLETLGWVVLRGVEVTESISTKIDEIIDSGKWHSISTEKNRQMKYNHTSRISKKWQNEELVQFQADIERKLLSFLKKDDTTYCIGKFNVLRNNGIIETDQDPHYDYPPRVVK